MMSKINLSSSYLSNYTDAGDCSFFQQESDVLTPVVVIPYRPHRQRRENEPDKFQDITAVPDLEDVDTLMSEPEYITQDTRLPEDELKDDITFATSGLLPHPSSSHSIELSIQERVKKTIGKAWEFDPIRFSTKAARKGINDQTCEFTPEELLWIKSLKLANGETKSEVIRTIVDQLNFSFLFEDYHLEQLLFLDNATLNEVLDTFYGPDIVNTSSVETIGAGDGSFEDSINTTWPSLPERKASTTCDSQFFQDSGVYMDKDDADAVVTSQSRSFAVSQEVADFNHDLSVDSPQFDVEVGPFLQRPAGEATDDSKQEAPYESACFASAPTTYAESKKGTEIDAPSDTAIKNMREARPDATKVRNTENQSAYDETPSPVVANQDRELARKYLESQRYHQHESSIPEISSPSCVEDPERTPNAESIKHLKNPDTLNLDCGITCRILDVSVSPLDLDRSVTPQKSSNTGVVLNSLAAPIPTTPHKPTVITHITSKPTNLHPECDIDTDSGLAIGPSVPCNEQGVQNALSRYVTALAALKDSDSIVRKNSNIRNPSSSPLPTVDAAVLSPFDPNTPTPTVPNTEAAYNYGQDTATRPSNSQKTRLSLSPSSPIPFTPKCPLDPLPPPAPFQLNTPINVAPPIHNSPGTPTPMPRPVEKQLRTTTGPLTAARSPRKAKKHTMGEVFRSPALSRALPDSATEGNINASTETGNPEQEDLRMEKVQCGAGAGESVDSATVVPSEGKGADGEKAMGAQEPGEKHLRRSTRGSAVMTYKV